jgi:hypothetical protein
MTCHVHERIAVGNLERIGNELGAVIGLGESKVFANKVFVRCNFFAVEFRVVLIIGKVFQSKNPV